MRIDTAAISSGTRASKEANTNTSTASAAAPASSVSASTPNPSLACPPLASSFIPVTAIVLPGGSSGLHGSGDLRAQARRVQLAPCRG